MKHAYVFPGQRCSIPRHGKVAIWKPWCCQKIDRRGQWYPGFPDIRHHVQRFGRRSETNQYHATSRIHTQHAAFQPWKRKAWNGGGHSLGNSLPSWPINTGFCRCIKTGVGQGPGHAKACEINPSTMAAVLGFCWWKSWRDLPVYHEWRRRGSGCRQYNCPGQLVISGSLQGVEIACERLKAAGAKRALILPVGGAFHSPDDACREELAAAIEQNHLSLPFARLQNINASAVTDPASIKENLAASQLTGLVKWTQCVQAMVADRAGIFTNADRVKYCTGTDCKIHKETRSNGVSWTTEFEW